jgi:hypothetical protein
MSALLDEVVVLEAEAAEAAALRVENAALGARCDEQTQRIADLEDRIAELLERFDGLERRGR